MVADTTAGRATVQQRLSPTHTQAARRPSHDRATTVLPMVSCRRVRRAWGEFSPSGRQLVNASTGIAFRRSSNCQAGGSARLVIQPSRCPPMPSATAKPQWAGQEGVARATLPRQARAAHYARVRCVASGTDMRKLRGTTANQAFGVRALGERQVDWRRRVMTFHHVTHCEVLGPSVSSAGTAELTRSFPTDCQA